MKEIKERDAHHKAVTTAFKLSRSRTKHRNSVLDLSLKLEWLVPRFDQFQPDMWWVSTFSLLIRLCQSSLLAWLRHQPIQAALASGITQVAICVQNNLNPHRRESDNAIALYSQWLIFVWFALFFMYLIKTFRFLSPVAVGLLFIVPSAAFIVRAVHSAFADLKNQLRRDRERGRKTYQKGDFVVHNSDGSRKHALTELDFDMLYEPSFEQDEITSKTDLELYRPTGKMRAHKLSADDVATRFPAGQLIMSDGTTVRVREGDVLVLPYPASDGLSIVERDAFSEKFMDVSFSTSMSAAAANTQTTSDEIVPSQADVLAHWRPKLQEDVRTYRKTTKVHAMLCLEDGVIETVVDGVVEARKRCNRGDYILIGSMGGRYTMNELSFAMRYDRTRPESAIDPALTKEGFQLYSPTVKIWAHVLTKGEVSSSFPSGRFRSKRGGLVAVQPGDSIVMPHPAADEIYAIPKRIFAASYGLQTRGHQVPSQSEALEQWRDVIQAKGKIYCRSDSHYFKQLVSDGELGEGNEEHTILSPTEFSMLFAPICATVPGVVVPSGLQVCHSVGKIWALRISAEDTQTHFPGGRFIASSGAEVSIESGDFLVMPFPCGLELSVVPKQDFERKYSDAANASTSVIDDGVPTQANVLSVWQVTLNTSGKLYRKTVKVNAKVAIGNGVLENVIDGMVAARTSYSRGDFIAVGSKEMRYVIPGLAFAAEYDRLRPEATSDDALAHEGFQSYSPREKVMARELNKDDLRFYFPSGRFIDRWGRIVAVSAGDFLATSSPAVDEVFAIPNSLFSVMYEPYTETDDALALSQSDALAYWKGVLQRDSRLYCRATSVYAKRALEDGTIDDAPVIEVNSNPTEETAIEMASITTGVPRAQGSGR